MQREATFIATALLATVVAISGASRVAWAGRTRIYYIAAEEMTRTMRPSAATSPRVWLLTTRRKYSQSARRTGSDHNIKRPSTFSIPTGLSAYVSRDHRHGSISAFLGRSFTPRSATRFRVVFRNKASQAFSIHPHGVFYTRANEGALTNDGTSAAQHAGGRGSAGRDLCLLSH